uniref:C2H2-type domain-containing protein n=1 Tax=Periophthalmus magnuspinnatus TaxID=409849 RepID=A0A3B3ZTP7_9GOBI
MSKSLTLRALVSARLTAAADDIFALFERTIAEYEEQLRQTQEETRTRQHLHRCCAAESPGTRHRAPGSPHGAGRSPSCNPDALPSSYIPKYQMPSHPPVSLCIRCPPILLHPCVRCPSIFSTLPVWSINRAWSFKRIIFIVSPAGVQTVFVSSYTEIPLVKEEPEEQSVKQEEEHHRELTVCVKREECELRDETQGGDISAETQGHVHIQTSGHTNVDEDWRVPFSCSNAQPETEADGGHFRGEYATNSGPFADFRLALEPSVFWRTQDMPGDTPTDTPTDIPTDMATDMSTDVATDTPRHRDMHQCPLCFKMFITKSHLQRHSTVHSGEKPFSCSVCNKRFNSKSYLIVHMRSHTGERPYSCPFCNKGFSHKSAFNFHVQTHSNERPYSCSVCGRSFTVEAYLKVHMKTHSGERPYGCSVCGARFGRANTLRGGKKTTKEKEREKEGRGTERRRGRRDVGQPKGRSSG